MWNLVFCRRTSLTSQVRTTRGLCSYLVSGSKKLSSVESVDEITKFQRKEKKKSIVVSYLVKYCGFTPESVKSPTKYVQFSSPEKPDAILKLLKEYGFTLKQINKVIKSYPQILMFSPDKTLLPKLQFVGSVGVLGAERTKLITSCPTILATSLKNKLIPSYKALTSVLTPDDIKLCLKRNSRLLVMDVQKHLAAKISILNRYGVPEKHLRKLIRFAPRILSFPTPDKFEEIFKRVIDLGFKPTQMKFLYAVAVLSQLHDTTWKHKMSVYKSLGWSEDDILQAFKVCPLSMSYSEKKIRSAVDFYVNNLGLSSSFFPKTPMIIGYSFEKRIKPRCSVMAILLAAGVLDSFSYNYILTMSEKQFMDRFVTKYREEFPQLLKCFPGKVTADI